MKDIKLSAVIIIRNEAKTLAKCLDSLKFIADEIIIIHDGVCEDDSLDIARRYTDQVYEQSLAGACELHYAFAFQKCRGEWILKLDGDEFLSPALATKIPELLEDQRYGAYSFLWSDYDLATGEFLHNRGRYKSFLFLRSQIKALGIIHFPIESSGETKKISLPVGHVIKPWSWSWEKYNLWAEIQARQLKFNEYEAWQTDIFDYPSKGRQLFIVHPLIFGLPRAMLILLREIIVNQAYYYRLDRLLLLIFSQIYYNLALAWYLFKLKI